MSFGLWDKEYLEAQRVDMTHAIYVEDLFRRWPGITEGELLALVVDQKLSAFISIKDQITQDGIRTHRAKNIAYRVDQNAPFIQYKAQIENILKSENVIFCMHDIINLEVENEELTWLNGDPARDETSRQRYNSKQSGKYACDRLPRRWACNPRYVLSALNNQRNGLRHFPDKQIPGVNKLAYFYVVHHDLVRWESDNEHNQFRADLKSTADDSCDAKCTIIAEENTSLKAVNTSLQQKLAVLMVPEIRPVLKTTKASEAKRDKTAKDWAESLEKAVGLAVDCAKSDKPKSIKQHQTMWAKLWVDTESNEPRKAAFRAFRKGLPSELKSRKKE